METEFHDKRGGDRSRAPSGIPDSGDAFPDDPVSGAPRLSAPKRRGKRIVKKGSAKRKSVTPEQRLLILDTWARSGLSGTDFAPLVGLSHHTLYKWKKRFDEDGPAGLMDKPRGRRKGSRLSEPTKRAILMMKQQHPDWGCQRISDMLTRGPALFASPNAVSKFLHESGYETVDAPTRPHPDKIRRFERDAPMRLWQTDLFTFTLKRRNRRVHLVGFMDDHSRFITGFGLHGSASSAMVIEAFRSAIASHGAPEEILTDNGSQYVTWRGKSAFSKECEKRGVKQIVARPRRPQTLGKIERFWGSLWRECLETAVFLDMADARERIGQYVDHYNFQRTHQGIKGLTPADRFFKTAPDVMRMLQERVASNALELAVNGKPREPFYITGRAGGKSFSVHAEGERVIFMPESGERREIELNADPGESGRTQDPAVDPNAETGDFDAPPTLPEPSNNANKPETEVDDEESRA